jgi:hypothetical protein
MHESESGLERQFAAPQHHLGEGTGHFEVAAGFFAALRESLAGPQEPIPTGHQPSTTSPSAMRTIFSAPTAT